VIKKLVLNSIILTVALTGNIESVDEEFIDDDVDYLESNLVELWGSHKFSFNSAKAKDIEVITVEGIRHDSSYYGHSFHLVVDGLATLNCDNSPYNPGCAWDTDRSGEVDSSRDDACEEVADTKPQGCNPSVSRKEILPNGCSVPFGVSGAWGDSYFLDSCNRHDQCYTTLSAEQGVCDANFANEMLSQCSNPPPGTNTSFCQDRARDFYAGVATAGFYYFKKAQRHKACVEWSSERSLWGCPRT